MRLELSRSISILCGNLPNAQNSINDVPILSRDPILLLISILLTIYPLKYDAVKELIKGVYNLCLISFIWKVMLTLDTGQFFHSINEITFYIFLYKKFNTNGLDSITALKKFVLTQEECGPVLAGVTKQCLEVYATIPDLSISAPKNKSGKSSEAQIYLHLETKVTQMMMQVLTFLILLTYIIFFIKRRVNI